MVRMMKVSDLKPHPRNSEFFDDIVGDSWDEFLRSVSTSGVIEPIIITEDNVIVSGHQRVRACKELGIKKIHYKLIEPDMFDDDISTYTYIHSNMNHILNKSRITKLKFCKCINEIFNYYDRKRKYINALKREHAKIQRDYINKNRTSIIKKIGNKCCICGNDFSDIMHIHFRIPIEEWGNSDVNNLTVLCPNCHGVIHKVIDYSKNNDVDLERIFKKIQEEYSYSAYIRFFEEYIYYLKHRKDYM